jgi:hypothetical protein
LRQLDGCGGKRRAPHQEKRKEKPDKAGEFHEVWMEPYALSGRAGEVWNK